MSTVITLYINLKLLIKIGNLNFFVPKRRFYKTIDSKRFLSKMLAELSSTIRVIQCNFQNKAFYFPLRK